MTLENNTTFPLMSNETALGKQNSLCDFADSPLERISKVCGYCVVLLGSFFGNIFIIVIVYKDGDLRKTVNYFIVNMAMSDLLSSLIIIPVEITALMTDPAHWGNRGMLGSGFFCKLVYFVGPVSLQVTAQSLVWIAIDRFVAIVFPIKLGLISNKIRTTAIVSTWIIAGLFNLQNLIEYRHNTYCADSGSIFKNQEPIAVHIVKWLHLTFFLFVPLFLIKVLYTAIAIALRKALAETAPNVQRHYLKKRRQAIQMTVVIVVLFYICVFPYALLNIIPSPSCAFQRLLMFLAFFMVFSSSIVNPIICLSFVESYRRGLRNILCPCSRKWNNKKRKRAQITLKGVKHLTGDNCPQVSNDLEKFTETLETVL